MCREFCTPTQPYKPTDIADVDIVRKRGIDLLHDPLYNKVCPWRISVHGSTRLLKFVDLRMDGLKGYD